MNHNEDILKKLKEESEMIKIPDSLQPDNMMKMIKSQEAQRIKTLQKKRKFIRKITTVAASLVIICLVGFGTHLWMDRGDQLPERVADIESLVVIEEAQITEATDNGLKYPKISYEDIYQAMSATWDREYSYMRNEIPMAEPEAVVTEEAAEDVEMGAMKYSADESYNETNVQTVGVDEGDIVKNDGRYLYQKIQVLEEKRAKWVIQVIDTKDGLKEVARIDGIEGLLEFYIWEDLLVTIEEKYLSHELDSVEEFYAVKYFGNNYHEIKIFDIEDRTQPKEIETFHLQGQYASSRIADGYFYGFSKYYTNPGKGKNDYAAYIPEINGERIVAEKIFLPEELDVTSYLVLVAIDLRNPTKFTDTTAIVSGAQNFYVSSENIFVADAKRNDQREGWNSNQTKLLRFSYGDGKFSLRALGEVNGRLDSQFSMDESEKHLRIVTTVTEYYDEKIIDDRTGNVIGYTIDQERQANALYVLDERLDVVGEIEGLAKDEQIYSARFMGDVGYFVTFRQTDPLFTVDLKDPHNPKILSELKVSGFSEYLHIYGENRLLGIGMEADPETGIQQGMKLSMFDVSDKANVTEVSKTNLSKYNYSEALYNHHAVLINVGKNIFGFAAEGSSKGDFCYDYVIYTYENDEFVQKLKVNAKNKDGNHYTVRGSYIGDVFYLLRSDGSVESYNLNDGRKLNSLEP